MARKKFTAQSTSRGSGLLSRSHQVLMRNGRPMEVTAMPTKVSKGEQEPEIGDAKRRILNRLPLQDAQARRIMRQSIAKARLTYKEADRVARRNGGELRVVEKSQYRGELTNIAVDAVRDMRAQVLSNIESSVKTYLIAIRRTLPDKDQLPMSKIREISQRVAIQVYQSPIGAEGKTSAQRIAALGVKVEAELYRGLDRAQRSYDRMGKALVDPRGSHRSCVSRGISRINRTEQSRALHEATLEAGKLLGIKLYYWRLSSAHKSYGGTEICEVLSVNTGLDVLTTMPEGFSRSIEGLYTADSLPQLPHPNCMCSIEPVVN